MAAKHEQMTIQSEGSLEATRAKWIGAVMFNHKAGGWQLIKSIKPLTVRAASLSSCTYYGYGPILTDEGKIDAARTAWKARQPAQKPELHL